MAKLAATTKEPGVAEMVNEPVLQTFEQADQAAVTPIPEAVAPVAAAYPPVMASNPAGVAFPGFPPVQAAPPVVAPQFLQPQGRGVQQPAFQVTPAMIADMQEQMDAANRLIEVRVRENIPRTYIVNQWWTFTKMKPVKVPMFVRDWLLEKNLI